MQSLTSQDLSSLFTWNTKQVFLYVTTSWPNKDPSKPPSRAVVWDAILPHPLAPNHHNQWVHPGKGTKAKKSSSKSRSKSKTKSSSKAAVTPTKSTYRSSFSESAPGIIRLDNQRPKYQITDLTGKLASLSGASLELHWNIQPWVGLLTWNGAGKSGTTEAPWWSVWKHAGSVAKSELFDFPALKNSTEAAKAAGEKRLDTEKGAEGNRGRPA